MDKTPDWLTAIRPISVQQFVGLNQLLHYMVVRLLSLIRNLFYCFAFFFVYHIDCSWLS